jgi:hypothetical protein
MNKIIKTCNIMIGICGAFIICISTDFIVSKIGIAPKGTSWLMFPIAFMISKGIAEEDRSSKHTEEKNK